jgi:hypothetical protein
MRALALLSLSLALPLASNAAATVVQTFGSGSAVSVVQATADFESTNALFDNPYVEGGMSFSRTNLSLNNNSCGFAGANCSGNPAGFAGFSGNFMYGALILEHEGFFDISAPNGLAFSGLELLIGTGYQLDAAHLNFVSWKAFKSASQVGAGSFSAASVVAIGFSDPAGFDTLRITNSFAADDSTHPAPAFDTVRAQFVPEPHGFALLSIGLLGIALIRRRTKYQPAQ